MKNLQLYVIAILVFAAILGMFSAHFLKGKTKKALEEVAQATIQVETGVSVDFDAIEQHLLEMNDVTTTSP